MRFGIFRPRWPRDETAGHGLGGRGPANQPSDDLDTAPLLSIRDLRRSFGGVVALDGISFDMKRGSVLGLIGPNGAGKTTLFNCLNLIYKPLSGDILFEGRSLLSRRPDEIAGIGIGRTFQNLALFPSLSVLDNVKVGAHSQLRGGLISDALFTRSARRNEQLAQRNALQLLTYLDLEPFADTRANELPFGTQKRVELARALATNPRLLLLDEPACGLNHEEVGALGQLIRRIRDELGISILLVEHHMALVMSISDHIVVLNFGGKIAEGTPAQIQSHPEVITAYLGADAA